MSEEIVRSICKNAIWLYIGVFLAANGFNFYNPFFYVAMISFIALINLHKFALRD